MSTNTSNDAQWSAPSTGADHLWFYDHSATALVPLAIGTNLSISDTTLNASAGAGGYSTIQEEGVTFTNGDSNTVINFIGAGITAADAGSNTTSVTLDATLNALAGLNSTAGVLVQTGADTFTKRTITGTTDRISVSNGDGVSGNPTVDIAASYGGQTSINTLGTIGTGVWQGTAIEEPYGGTGITTYAKGDILYASASNTLAKLPIGTDGYILRVNTDVPAWEQLASTDLTDTNNIAYLDGDQTFTGNNVFDENITMNGTPSANTDVITVGYLNTILANQTRQSVVLATTGNITLSGEQSIDGTVTSSTKVLVKDQTNAAENGIYISNSGAWTRHPSMDAASDVDGTFVIVEDGASNAGTFWYTISEVTTLGTDDIDWTWLPGATDIDAGAGLAFSGLTLNVGQGDGITVNANDIEVNLAANSGLEFSSGALRIKRDTTTGSTLALTLTSNGAGTQYDSNSFSEAGDALTLAANVAGPGLGLATGQLSVNVDDTTIEISTDTLQVKDGGITYAKIQDVAEDRLLGRDAGGSGPVQEISIGSGLTFNNSATLDHADTSSVSNVNTSGAQIIDTITFDTYGHVTAVTTRNLAINDVNDVTITSPNNGEVLTYSGGTWVNSTASGSVTIGFIEGATGTSVDLDTAGNVKDKDGTNSPITVTDENKIFVYLNGQRLAQSGSVTTRDYDFSAGNVLEFETITLVASDIVMIEQWS